MHFWLLFFFELKTDIEINSTKILVSNMRYLYIFIALIQSADISVTYSGYKGKPPAEIQLKVYPGFHQKETGPRNVPEIIKKPGLWVLVVLC